MSTRRAAFNMCNFINSEAGRGKATGRALNVEFMQNENLLDSNFWRRFLLSTNLEFLGQN